MLSPSILLNPAPSDAAAGAEIREPLKQSPPTADQGFDARVFGAHFHHAAKRSSIFVAKLFAYEFREEHRVLDFELKDAPPLVNDLRAGRSLAIW